MIFNLGSINSDLVYGLPHFPAPGETLSAINHRRGLGGKGANQSIALARAGATVTHIGAVGPDGAWMTDQLRCAGVECDHIQQLDCASGHAVIYVDPHGENSIVIYPGANVALRDNDVMVALAQAGPDDILVLQNETSALLSAARAAHAKGMFIAYSAAPFDAQAVRDILPYLSLLLCNEGEARQLSQALGLEVSAIPVKHLVITKGAKGAVWLDPAADPITVPSFKVIPVDTTGAGDTFAGYLVAGLSEGKSPANAMHLASAAAALSVTRAGAADAIPTRAEVDAFWAAQPKE
ncbi:ribokinase [Thioclava sp. SK-1]|uniref:ribokinase n=1 Tax=Thioclava sp. SK-1 TaxID=1889770 RepID=UPI000825691E|nr:ribokinase [Thioclava sp. SK-1]OCX61622.1 ribokinase [Thioclava sp. SK-1]